MPLCGGGQKTSMYTNYLPFIVFPKTEKQKVNKTWNIERKKKFHHESNGNNDIFIME